MAGSLSRDALADGTAIALSSACLIHCLMLPLVSAVLPVLGIWAEAEWLHKAFVAAALPFSLIALTSKRTPLVFGVLIFAGFILLAAGAFVEAWHDYELQLTVLGALVLASGHALRWRLR